MENRMAKSIKTEMETREDIMMENQMGTTHKKLWIYAGVGIVSACRGLDRKNSNILPCIVPRR